MATHHTSGTDGNGVFYVCRAEALQQEPMGLRKVHSVHSGLDTVTAWVYLCWNYGETSVALEQKDQPHPHGRGDAISKCVHV